MSVLAPVRHPFVAVLGVAAVAALAGCALTTPAAEPSRDAEGAIAAPQDDADVFALTVGDCTNDADSTTGEVSSVDAVPCVDAHDNEVYAAFDLPGGAFPGTTEVQDLADEGCLAEFEPFVGAAYETSRYALYTLAPTATSWASGDQEVLCLLYDVDGVQLTGSAAGTGE
jgi:hypothetical protein